MSALVLAAYGVSGAAGLIYEVAWTRLLTLRLGHTTAAASTVLAAFMGGLALGAVAGGRAAARANSRHALRLYIALELAVAVLATLLPWQLDAFTPLLRAAYDDGQSAIAFPAARLTTCFVLLMIPAAALGASFPCATRALESTGGRAGALYAVNTVGAAVGAASAGFVLLPALGLLRTTLVGVPLTITASMLACAALRRMPTVVGKATAPGTAAPKSAERSTPRGATVSGSRRADASLAPVLPWVVPFVAAATGFAGFVLEVGWTRVFALVVGPSAYAFASMLVCFIASLALGSVAGHLLSARLRRPLLLLAPLLFVTSVLACAATAQAGTELPLRIAEDLVASTEAASVLLMRHARWAALVVMPPVVCLGAVFPILLALARGGASSPTRVAQLYAANTVAGVAGALASGFVLLPVLGLERTLQSAALVLASATVAVCMTAWSTSWMKSLATVPAVVVPLILVSGTRWDHMLIASGAYKYAHYLVKGDEAAAVLRAGTLHYYRDGAASTVAVRELTGTRSLSIDGKIDASSGGDMTTQKVLAHLPLLLHPQPVRVLVVGLGSGVTAGAALTHPVGSVDVVELSREVVDASAFFAKESGNALADPRVRLIVGDGRSHLLLGRERYDVIVSEPSNPWMAGVAALFTREFFEAARARLAPGGILCQWSHAYDISTDDLRSIAATFASVFPQGTMWLVGEGDMLLVGSDSPLDDRLASIGRHWSRPGVAEDLAKGGVAAPFSLLSTFAGGPAQLRAFAASAPVQRDDRMALEYTGPLAVNGQAHAGTVEQLLALQGEVWRDGSIADAIRTADAGAWAARGSMLLTADAFDSAYASFDRALALEPSRLEAARGLVRSAAARQRLPQAEERLLELSRQHPSASALLIALSQVRFATGRVQDAAAAASTACERNPDDADAFAQLASVHAESGNVDALAAVVSVMTSRFPMAGATAYYVAAGHFLEGNLPAARTAAYEAVTRSSRSAPAQNLLGAIHASDGDTSQARVALAEALRLDAHDQAAYVNLARLEAQAGERARALQLYAEALTLDPASDTTREEMHVLTGGR